MGNLQKIRFLFIYFLISCCELFIINNSQQSIELLFKPFICFSLILFLIDNRYFKNFITIYLALICGLIGDLLIIFPDYFTGALISFLCGHIMYITAFIQQNDFKLYKNKFITWLIISLISTYLLLFYYYIKSYLGNLQIPVLIYMLVISFMFISTYLRKRYYGYYYLIFGSLSFIISDSIIAINQFISKFLYSNELALITYVLAQFFIVFGFTKYNINNKTIKQ